MVKGKKLLIYGFMSGLLAAAFMMYCSTVPAPTESVPTAYENPKDLFEERTYTNPQFMPEIEKKTKEYRWRGMLTQDDDKFIVSIMRNRNAVEKELETNKNSSYRNWILVQKMASFDIMEENYQGAVDIWKKYAPLFPERKQEIAELIAILGENETGIEVSDLGPEVNSGEVFYPVVESEGKKLYFTGFNIKGFNKGEDIYEASFENGTKIWTAVTPVTFVNSMSHEMALSISQDGMRMLIFGNYVRRYAQGDIYYSDKFGNGWTPPKLLPYPVNSINFDSDAVFTPDRRAVIFTSDRDGSYFPYIKKGDYYTGNFWGNTDIYISFIRSDGTFTAPRNLGPIVNTPGAERTPFIHPDGKTLFFSSTGYTGFGGFDVYKTVRQDETWQKWSKPVHVGKYVNTHRDDWGFSITASGDRAFLTRASRVSGTTALYSVAPLPKRLEPASIVGSLAGKIKDETGKITDGSIYWKDLGKEETDGRIYAKDDTGAFFMNLPIGKKYLLIATKKGFFAHAQYVDLKAEKKYVLKKPEFILTSITSLLKGQEIRLDQVVFASKSSISELAAPLLEAIAITVDEQPEVKLELYLHGKETGKDFEERSKFLGRYLAARGGSSANIKISEGDAAAKEGISVKVIAVESGQF